jgi:hypothetical protein
MASNWEIQDKELPYDLLVNIAPGTSKSTVISKFGAVYAWTKNNDLTMISSSYAAKATKSFTNKFKKLINSDEFLEIYPELELDEDNVGEQSNHFKGRRYATSTGGSITSIHGDLIIVDDHNQPPKIERDDNGRPKLTMGATLTQIEAGNAWHDDVLSSRKTNKEYSRSIYVQQRVHRKDLSGYLIKKAEQGAMNLKHIVLPATIEKGKNEAYSRLYINGIIHEEEDLEYLYDETGLLDPVRMKRKTLVKEKKIMGSHVYSAQYLQQPKKEKGGVIKPEWFEIVNIKDVPDGLVSFFYTDPSEGKKNSDNMASACWSMYEGNAYIWDLMAVIKPFNEFIGYRDENGEYINKVYDNFVVRNGNSQHSKHFFEAKSAGTPYIQYMNARTKYNAIPDIPKGSKMDRVYLSQGRMEAGRVKLVSTGISSQDKWIEELLEECKDFAGLPGDVDDRVDVLTGLIKVTAFDGSVFEPNEEDLQDSDIEEDETELGEEYTF